MINHHRMTLSDCLSLIPNASSIAKTPLQDRSVQPKVYLNERYCVLDLIGQGGFGRTFLAIDESHSLQSPCVIKQLFLNEQNTGLQQKAVEQFHQEALQLSELGNHSQIPQLLDFFEQDGHCYLVQEWIDGQNLEQELSESSPFNEAEIRQLLHELLPVLQFIHDRQVIHRDIKPANIVRRGCDRQLVLVDFGAAKCLTATESAHTGTLIGSAEYTAPEQLKGKAILSSDLYSLGVTCLHLMTQQSPFALFDSSENAWKWREFLDEPISESLGYILDKLLLSATRQRYQSASEVLEDLDLVAKPVLLKRRSSAKIDEVSVSQEHRQLASLEAVASYLPLRSDVSATVFDSSTKTWHYVTSLETLDLAEKSTSRLSPRLAAAAATPPLQKEMSDEEEMADINDCLKWIWQIITLTIITSLATATLVIVIAAIESKFSTTAPKVETVMPVQGSGSSSYR